MGRKIYIKRYILGISLTRETKLKRMLAGYLIKISIKGGRHQPIRLSNKSGKYLIFSGLGIRPLY